MWTWALIIGVLVLLVLVAKLVERRAARDGTGDDDMQKVMRARMRRGDSSGGPMPLDGGGSGDGGGGGA